MITIYHNPRCGKSREALKLLEQSGKAFQVRLYLQDSLTFEELKVLQALLGIPAIEMVRTKEVVWKEKYADSVTSDEDVLNAIVKDPILLERAVVEDGQKAVIARPPEKVRDIIG
jgi:arsenate reductase (glutaredoxin)